MDMTATHVTSIDDPDHELVDHLLTYRAPTSAEVVTSFAHIRAAFLAAGHLVVDQVPRTPDRTVALRKIHEACMASIAALALNAPGPDAAVPDPSA